MDKVSNETPEKEIIEETVEDVVQANGDSSEQETAETQEAAEPTLEEQLEVAQAEAAKNLDGWLRAQADLANARKRFEKQRTDAYINAKADVAKKLLPVIDDYERAMANAPEEITSHSWYEGIQLVYRKLNSILESMDVQPIDAVGQPFDPNFHEALSQEPSDEYESGVVVRELQKGYQLGDRVIRPSLVVVAE